MIDLVRIGDVCVVVAGQSPVGTSYNTEARGIEFHQGKKLFGENKLRVSNIYTDQPSKIAEPGDILMSVRAPVGPVNLTDRRICIGRGLAAIRAGEKIDQDYLFYYLRMNESNINGREGATFSSINKTEIENLRLALPPIKEQRAIVSYLNKTLELADHAIDLTNKKLLYLDDLKQSVLERVFSTGKVIE